MDPIGLEEIHRARERLGSSVLRTPLVPLDGSPDPPRIFLKLDCLQPTGSFKVRGAGNSLASALESGPVPGVYTTSAGNMGQALAWHAHRRNVPCTVIAPDTAPRVKLAGIERHGARIVQLPWDEVWHIGETRSYAPLADQRYLHPFADRPMIVGNATAGLEIADELPDVATVFVPFGGGGLIAGVASALRLVRPSCRVVACEPETAAPFAASLAAGRASSVDRRPSFVDGIGARNVIPEMWDTVHGLVTEARTPSLRAIADAVRFCFERHRVVVEGAGAASLAAALAEPPGRGPAVALISGGNIDLPVLEKILGGGVP